MDHQQERFYQKKWFAIVMLILLAPLGVYLIWTNDHFNRKTNIVLTVIFSLFFIVVIFSEGDDDIQEVDAESEEVLATVELTLDAEMIDDVIEFHGETNLPDGAMITYEIWHEEDFEAFVEGNLEVEEGIYDEEVSVVDWPDGEVVVWVAFKMMLGPSVSQPDEVIEIFGELGENIDGDNVSEIDEMKLVELELTLIKEAAVEEEEIDESADEKEEVTAEVEIETDEGQDGDIEEDVVDDVEENEFTIAQRLAIEAAEDYISFTAFSETGLIEQLEFEGFEQEDAVYAVNAIDVDWQEQAMIKAEDYLSFTSFSETGLIEQLEFEGFDQADAIYGVNAIDTDWQEQAMIKAEDYLSYTAFSQTGLMTQLEFEGFDYDDAVYAVEAIDVDWQEQANMMAENYLVYSGFSRSGLIEQLEFEGFNIEQATLAVDEAGL